jgi:hypothetical protein
LEVAVLTLRQAWLLAHIGLASGFIHSFLGGTLALIGWGSPLDVDQRRRRNTVVMAALAWLTVLTGTWTVYAWYRAEPPPQATSLVAFPKAYLLAHPNLAVWHDFAMEWKEHVGWLAPILATAVAVMALRHRDVLTGEWRVRRLVVGLFSLAFVAALIAAALGAAINKVAPNQFLNV